MLELKNLFVIKVRGFLTIPERNEHIAVQNLRVIIKRKNRIFRKEPDDMQLDAAIVSCSA